jgi:hypothetical protein
MTDWRLGTPVVFCIFNRPQTAARVFAAIAEARPPKLLVVADGPRPNHPEDVVGCRDSRALVERVNWDCEVRTRFASVNIGSTLRIPTGLDWVFENEEQAIILEDDCLPHPDLFRFCDELLAKYRDDERVAQIGGSNLQYGRNRTADSYYFSRFTHIWGWATWRRAWRRYDASLSTWPPVRDTPWLHGLLGDAKQERYWRRIFDRVASGRQDAWDYQWTYACWRSEALCALPSANLVSNIGHGPLSSHTRVRSPLANVPTEPLDFPLRHPRQVVPSATADAFTAKTVYQPFVPRMASKIRHDPRGLAAQLEERALRRLRKIVSRGLAAFGERKGR